MKETYEFRLSAEFARLVLTPTVKATRVIKNEVIGDISVLTGLVGDAAYCRVEKIVGDLALSGAKVPLWTSSIKRLYTEAELNSAELFLLRQGLGPGSGWEFGTWYTDGVFNRDCGLNQTEVVGAGFKAHPQFTEPIRALRCALSSRQVGPLRFPLRKLSKRFDLHILWSGEFIVPERFAILIREGKFSGAALHPIWNTKQACKNIPDLSMVPTGQQLISTAKELGLGVTDRTFWSWLEEEEQLPLLDKALRELMLLDQFGDRNNPSEPEYSQLVVRSRPLVVAKETLFGDSRFRPGLGQKCNCEFGEIPGLNLLSALSIIGSSWDGSDICHTDVHIGSRLGLFRPRRMLVISRRLFAAMRQLGIKSLDYEIVTRK